MAHNHLTAFLRNRLTKPVEGRNFRVPGIVRPLRTHRNFHERHPLVCLLAFVAVVAVFVAQLVYGVSL